MDVWSLSVIAVILVNVYVLHKFYVHVHLEYWKTVLTCAKIIKFRVSLSVLHCKLQVCLYWILKENEPKWRIQRHCELAIYIDRRHMMLIKDFFLIVVYRQENRQTIVQSYVCWPKRLVHDLTNSNYWQSPKNGENHPQVSRIRTECTQIPYRYRSMWQKLQIQSWKVKRLSFLKKFSALAALSGPCQSNNVQVYGK